MTEAVNNEEVDAILAAVSGEEAPGEVEQALDAAEQSGDDVVGGDEVEASAETEESAPDVQAQTDEVVEDKYEGWESVKVAEKRNRQTREELKSERDELIKMRTTIESNYKDFEEKYKKLNEDPLGYLETIGISKADLARRLLNDDGAASPEELTKRQSMALEEKIARLEAKLEEQTKTSQEKETQRMLDEYRNGISSALKDPELELLAAYPDAEDEVYQLAVAWAQRNQELLTPKDAAVKIQNELRERLRKFSSHEAARKVLFEDSGLANTSTPSGKVSAPQRTKTLTNKQVAAPVSSEERDDWSSLSEQEQIERALRHASQIAGVTE